MSKVIDFLKKKYKIMIPIMVVLVLLLTVYFLYKEYKYDNMRNKKEISVIQYFGGLKTEYTAIFTYNLNDNLVDVTAKNKKIEYDSTPIYCKDGNKVVFPEEMTIIFPLRGGSQYKLYKYSIYDKSDNLHLIEFGKSHHDYTNFFLFDGKNTFFFPDDVSLKITGTDDIKLGGGSYVKLVGGYTLEYYDRGGDKANIIDVEGKDVVVQGDKLDANLKERYLLSFGKKILLVGPTNLDGLTIDKE